MRRSKRNITLDRRKVLLDFQKILGIRFKSQELLNTALSHKSYVHETDGVWEDYEKLEFLGDAFLGLIISDCLYRRNLASSEGSLARTKSYVVSEQTLHRIGQEINIQKYLLIGKGEEKSGGRNRKGLIGDSVEAVIGAYYLDSGYKHARKLVEKLFFKEIIEVEKNRHEKDYKSILQEYVQKWFRTIPEYTVINTEGPDHRRTFFVKVSVKKHSYGPGIGKSKKQAEQNAARIALTALKKKRSTERIHSIQPGAERKTQGVKRERIVRANKRPKSRNTNAQE
jgi:ribonuclease-3